MIRYMGCLVALVLGGLLLSCQSTMETYDEFLIGGETVYVGKADSVIIEEGFNKLKFTVAINADPKIVTGLVSTSDESVYHQFDVVRTKFGRDTVSFDLEIPEGEYTFGVFLMDNYGNKSIRVESSAKVYGAKYISGLINRSLREVEIMEEDKLLLRWSSAIGTSEYTLVSYEDADGVMQEIVVTNDDSETILENYKKGGVLKISTIYRPTATAFEDFAAEPELRALPE